MIDFGKAQFFKGQVAHGRYGGVRRDCARSHAFEQRAHDIGVQNCSSRRLFLSVVCLTLTILPKAGLATVFEYSLSLDAGPPALFIINSRAAGVI
jgi:hypothetical protein